jgi:hypothetical protein
MNKKWQNRGQVLILDIKFYLEKQGSPKVIRLEG